MRHDILADVLSAIRNGDAVGQREALTPASRMTKAVLLIMQQAGFIGDFELVDDRRGGKFRIALLGNVNGCGAIRPRSAVAADGYERWERRFLPAAGFGLLIVSTPQGVLPHAEAKARGIGGRLLAYVY